MGTSSGYQSRAEGDVGPDLRGEPQDAPSSFSAALNYRWETCVDAIGKQAWDACFGTRNVYDSFELAQAVEKSRLPGVEHYYLVGERAGKAVFLLPCFRIRFSLSLLAPLGLQRWIARVRWLFPNALYFTAFVGGLPVAVCKDSLGMQQLSLPERPRVLREMKQLLLKQGRLLQVGFVTFKEITLPQMELIRAALVPEFHVIESLPTMYLPISLPGRPRYVERLRTKQRVLLRKRRRMFTEAGLRWETAVDFERYAEQFMPLYLQVLERAQTRLETLTPNFFREVSRRLGERSFTLLCFKGEELIAFELFLKDGRWLQPMYLGLNYAYRDQAAVYFNCLYQIIEECERRAYPVVQLGQSTYDAKGLLGAVMERLWFAIHHSNPVIHWVIGRLRSLVFPTVPAPQHQPFKDPELAKEILASRNVTCVA